MSKIYTIILLFFLSALAFGQQNIDRSQLFANQERISPAMVGANELGLIDVAYRSILNTNGTALNIYQAGVFMPLSNAYRSETDNSSFALSSPSLEAKINSSKKLRRKHGLGLSISSLNYANLSRNDLQLSYAYHLPLSSKLNFSLGTAIHWESNAISTNNLTVRDPANDLLFQEIQSAGGINNSNFFFDVGGSIYSDNFFLNVNLSRVNFLSNDQEQETIESLIPSLQLGYRIGLGANFSINSNVMARLNELFENDYIGAIRLNYRNLVYLGAAYHHDLKISGLIGLRLPKAIFMNYSYDIYNNSSNTISSGTHELSLQFLLKNKRSTAPFLW